MPYFNNVCYISFVSFRYYLFSLLSSLKYYPRKFNFSVYFML